MVCGNTDVAFPHYLTAQIQTTCHWQVVVMVLEDRNTTNSS